MDPLATIRRRHASQRLAGEPLAAPADTVRWSGAVQAQEFAGAKWSLAERSDISDAAVERAFAEGEILRTHLMRPTWHFVAAEDIRWLLRLTAPRVHVANRYWYGQTGLDVATLERCHEVIARELADGQPRTRKELALALAREGIEGDSLRIGYIFIHAELEQLVCSGPRRGKQHTYMLLDDRAPADQGPSGEAALAELAKRYLRSHGPARSVRSPRRRRATGPYFCRPTTSSSSPKRICASTWSASRHARACSPGRSRSTAAPSAAGSERSRGAR